MSPLLSSGAGVVHFGLDVSLGVISVGEEVTASGSDGVVNGDGRLAGVVICGLTEWPRNGDDDDRIGEPFLLLLLLPNSSLVLEEVLDGGHRSIDPNSRSTGCDMTLSLVLLARLYMASPTFIVNRENEFTMVPIRLDTSPKSIAGLLLPDKLVLLEDSGSESGSVKVVLDCMVVLD